MQTKKAGCFLINAENKTVALVYRKLQNDYSFPKGHVEEGEDFLTAAIRETAEETKRIAKVVKEIPPYIDEYTTPLGEDCVCYMFVATDAGKSDNDSLDTHPVVWVAFEDVVNVLTYESLKKSWGTVAPQILQFYGW